MMVRSRQTLLILYFAIVACIQNINQAYPERSCYKRHFKSVLTNPDIYLEGEICDTIIIQGNILQRVGHKAFARYKRLKELYLHNNLIHYMSPNALTGTPLNFLDLSHNKLNCIPILFSVRNTLETLVVSYNKLGNCTEDSQYLPYVTFDKLYRVFLDETELCRIPGIVMAATHLKELSMVNNLFKALPNLMEISSDFSILSLVGNTLCCDCELLWLYEMELKLALPPHTFECDSPGYETYLNWTDIDKVTLNQTCMDTTTGNHYVAFNN